MPWDQPIATFRRPPVVEVVAGVAFEGLSTSEATAYLSSFWTDQLRDRFPELELQLPYAPLRESFGGAVAAPAPPFEIQTGPPPVRLWASTPDGQELVQLQPGWFACNWRRVKPQDEYDRWQARRLSFASWYSELNEYLSKRERAPRIVQCEVSYINHIEASETWSKHAEFSKIFRVTLGSSAGRLEQVAAQASFLLGQDDRSPYGRLHVKLLPGFGPDGTTPVYLLELTARGPSLGDGIAGALNFLDRGRAAIVRCFLDLTTDEMQKGWGLQS